LKQRIVVIDTECFRDQSRERADAVLRPVKRSDHPQQIGFFFEFGRTTKYVQTGGDQALLDFNELLV